MKRLFVLCLFLLAFSTSVLAQDTALDPAAFLPDDVSVYVEMHADQAGIDALSQGISTFYRLLGVPEGADSNFATALDSIFPAASFSGDVLPWLGDHFALASFDQPGAEVANRVFVLPIGDPAGAQAFVEQMSARRIERDVLPDATLFFGGTFSLAVSESVIWYGTPEAVNHVMRSSSPSLDTNSSFRRVRSALPNVSPLDGYLSGAFINSALAQLQPAAGSAPFPATLAEALLRLHPVESAFKTALLGGAEIQGFGFAAQVDGEQMSADLVLALDAPTTTPDSPLTLSAYAPPNSFFVLDSYDVTTFAATLGGAASLLLPVQYVTARSTGELAPPLPSPEPATAQSLVAQAQPVIAQLESLSGLSLSDFYDLISGEYLFALFPGVNDQTSAALWVRSSFPMRVIRALEQASSLVLTDPDGTRLVNVEETNVNGVTVALVSLPGGGERLAIGALDPLLFVTNESSVFRVIAAAQSGAPRAWASSFDGQQDSAFYLDPRALDSAVLRQERTPPLPLTQLDGVFNVSDDGLFVLHLTAITAP